MGVCAVAVLRVRVVLVVWVRAVVVLSGIERVCHALVDALDRSQGSQHLKNRNNNNNNNNNNNKDNSIRNRKRNNHHNDSNITGKDEIHKDKRV